jgi:hypothetical protein
MQTKNVILNILVNIKQIVLDCARSPIAEEPSLWAVEQGPIKGSPCRRCPHPMVGDTSCIVTADTGNDEH